jgi:hypothetical protein
MTDSHSGALMQLARDWLKHCLENHDHCPCDGIAEGDLQLPTRVVDIGESEEIAPRLLITDGRKGKWAALSHRWGKVSRKDWIVGKKRVILTTKNITKLQQRIKKESLQVTFQDAITVTRALGLRYLWIDCLCILQDSTADWRRESGLMPAVYQHAYVTIGAGATQDNFGGIFGTRDWANGDKSRPVHVPIPCQYDRMAIVSFDFEIDRDDDIDNVSQNSSFLFHCVPLM